MQNLHWKRKTSFRIGFRLRRKLRAKDRLVKCSFGNKTKKHCLSKLAFTPEVVRRLAPILERKHYSVFADDKPPFPPHVLPSPSKLAASSAPSVCSVDSINGQAPAPATPITVVPDRGFLSVVGWCLSAGQKDVAGGVYVKLDGKYFPAYYGAGRPDVAAAFHNSGLVYSGFEAAVPVGSRRNSRHSLSVVALAPGATTSGGGGQALYYRPTASVRVVLA